VKYLSRKFLIAGCITITACIAFLFYDNKLTGSEFITLATLVLGTFTAGDVALNAIHKRNAEQDTTQ
jgi:hypothetical protein